MNPHSNRRGGSKPPGSPARRPAGTKCPRLPRKSVAERLRRSGAFELPFIIYKLFTHTIVVQRSYQVLLTPPIYCILISKATYVLFRDPVTVESAKPITL